MRLILTTALLGLGLSVVTAVTAGELNVQVMSADHQALPDVVVYVEPTTGSIKPSPPTPAAMDQLHKTFVPFILPVQVGTVVDFPNSDTVNHYVYSFSPAKRFQLKLFKSDAKEPHTVLFDKAGIVTLGCNIHDWMLAYIVVVNTPWFSQTDKNGTAKLNLPDGEHYRVSIWHPRIADTEPQLQRDVNDTHIEFQLQQPLKPDPRRSPTNY